MARKLFHLPGEIPDHQYAFVMQPSFFLVFLLSLSLSNVNKQRQRAADPNDLETGNEMDAEILDFESFSPDGAFWEPET